MLTDGTNFKCKDLKQINFIPDDRKILVNLYQVHAGRARIHFEDMEQVTMDLKSYLIKNDKFTNLFQVVSDSLNQKLEKTIY